MKLQLVPDQLKKLWEKVSQKAITKEQFFCEQERLLDEYRYIWERSLCIDTQHNLQQSMLSELSKYFECEDLEEIRFRCNSAVPVLKKEWQEKVVSKNRESIEQYYQENQTTIFELMWWHTLCDDNSPLAYVTALHFAQQHGCREYLDFGSGVGSGGILFARYDLEVTLADISSPLQQFCQWRFSQRDLSAKIIDLKSSELPTNSFDIITAMDVFEHLVDPVGTIDQLGNALKHGGFLFARLASEIDEDRPQHIVQDFGPTFERLQKLGFVQVWQDDWLWGHVVFQKPL